jgi:GNAT superfamily N-acetyltransferase
MEVRALLDGDRRWASALVTELVASPRVVSRGRVHDSRELSGLVAQIDGTPVGLLQYRLNGGQCEVVLIIAARRRAGVGRRLLEAIARLARARGCRRLWLVTTNDNRGAVAFYHSLGWRQVAVHRGAVREARRLKPEIPEFGADGTPIEDEIEFELRLDGD